MTLHADYLLNETLPKDAQRILENCLRYSGNAEATLDFLTNLEGKCHRYASECENSLGGLIQSPPLLFMKRCEEFDENLRRLLQGIGSRVDLTTFSPQPLINPEAGITAEHGDCESVSVDESGRARAGKSHVLRFRCGETSMEVLDNGSSAHILRFLAVNPKTSALTKLRCFSTMVRLLLRTFDGVTGTPAARDDNSIRMPNGEWRFWRQRSPWGFEISRLEKFWLRAGAVSTRLTAGNNSRLILYREEKAFEFLERFRKEKPEMASPFALACRFGVYGPATLQKLKAEGQ